MPRWPAPGARGIVVCFVFCSCSLLANPAGAQSSVVAFRGGEVHPISSPTIANGVVVIENGKIAAVGPASTRIPRGAQVIDVTGKVILPGLIDTHSHLGGGI